MERKSPPTIPLIRAGKTPRGQVALRTSAPAIMAEQDGRITIWAITSQYDWRVETPFDGHFCIIITPKVPSDEL